MGHQYRESKARAELKALQAKHLALQTKYGEGDREAA